MQTFLKWLAPMVALGVAIFLAFFLVSINSEQIIQEQEPLKLQTEVASKKTPKLWLDHFSTSKQKGYEYPVTEVFVKIDLNEKITKTITYKLNAKVDDPYKLFCLKEELDRHKLKYFLKKDPKGIDLLIYSKNVAKLRNLVEVLKNYKISAQIERYKEEY